MKRILLLPFLLASAALQAAPYVLDTSHTETAFSVRHLMVSNTKGRFTDLQGTVDFDEATGSIGHLTVTIQAKSIDTNDAKRDQHLRSADFFDVEKFPTLRFGLERATLRLNQPVAVDGELTIKGIKKPVTLQITYFGARTDPFKVRHAGFAATTRINRKDFGISWNAMLDEGGVAVGDDVAIEISAEIVAAPSLASQLQAVTESVKQQAPADILSTMEAATAQLQNSGLAQRALHVGDAMPEFSLPDPTGKLISSRELLSHGPLLVTFYRGNWCPNCNLALHALQDRLSEIKALGANLVAISPQTPDNSLTMQEKHALAFPVLSDAGLKTSRQFGLVYVLPESLRPIYHSFGIDLVKQNGTDTYELPVPATYLVDRQGRIREAFVQVDYRQRLEPATAIEWLKKLAAN